MVAIFSNKYVQILLAMLAALIFGFTSGYSYKADKVELERLQQFELIQGKLDKVYQFSQDEANKAKQADNEISIALRRILEKTKSQPLSNVPCEPTKTFSETWRAIDNVKSNTSK